MVLHGKNYSSYRSNYGTKFSPLKKKNLYCVALVLVFRYFKKNKLNTAMAPCVIRGNEKITSSKSQV